MLQLFILWTEKQEIDFQKELHSISGRSSNRTYLDLGSQVAALKPPQMSISEFEQRELFL